MRDFSTLTNRFIIEGKLDLLDALHVGSGQADLESDSPFFRGPGGAMVPGSSLRGVLRSTLERILQSTGLERGCVLFVPGSHPTCLTVNRKEEEAAKDLDETALARLLFERGGACHICQLFGSPWLASRLRVADCKPTKDKPAQLTVRDGVGIDRDTEAAKPKIKFNFEVMDNREGSALTLRLELENASNQDLVLIAILIDEMKSPGIQLGGKKSRGLGRVTLDKKYTVSYFDDFAAYLRKRTMTTMGGDSFAAQFLQPALESYLTAV